MTVVAPGTPAPDFTLTTESGGTLALADLRELRARLELDSGYLSRLVAALERDGLVELEPHPADRRVRSVSSAICTSAVPVSPSPFPNLATSSCLRSAVTLMRRRTVAKAAQPPALAQISRARPTSSAICSVRASTDPNSFSPRKRWRKSIRSSWP